MFACYAPKNHKEPAPNQHPLSLTRLSEYDCLQTVYRRNAHRQRKKTIDKNPPSIYVQFLSVY